MRKLTVRCVSCRGMTGSSSKNANSGFTLLETLIVVAILVVLLGLSMVGVARYRDYLKITELDNAARDIYMAAQNRAVLLQNSGRLEGRLAEGGGGHAVKLSADGSEGESLNHGTRYISNKTEDADVLNELVPVGSIDPTLRENGEFYIVYEPLSGSATDVFYVEKKNQVSIYEALNLVKDGDNRNQRMNNKADGESAMVGYYGGEKGAVIATRPLPSPGVEVFIENSDKLTLTVRYSLPDGLPGGVTYEPKVVLTYGTQEATLLKKDESSSLLEFSDGGGQLTSGTAISFTGESIGNPLIFTWVLDSLESGKQFKDIKSAFADLGGDFTVKASLKLTADGYIESAYYATGEDNSLFAKGSTYNTTDSDGNPNGTALIANLRHLQNLCHGETGLPGILYSGFTSKVGAGIKNAQQLCDIDCEKYLGAEYKFTPIVNTNLVSFNGKYEDKNTHIFNLSTIETADAGLFGKVTGSMTIANCRVCWKDPEKLVTPETNPTDYVYAVSGTTNAGGLIGSASGSTTIINSFAATTVSGAHVGGLVGSVSGGTNAAVTIKNSYADCYIKPGTGGDNSAGGLVGVGAAELTNCYAAGFIVDPVNDKTAGLVFGTGTTTASNTYSVVRVISATELNSLGNPGTLLYSGVIDADGSTVRYLYDVSTDFRPAGSAFAAAGTSETHFYNLRYKLSKNPDDELKTRYPFQGLKDEEGNAMPHYGDWCGVLPAVIRGMVYYEEYYHEGGTVTDAYGVPNDSAYVGAAGKYAVTGTDGNARYVDFNSYPLWKDFSNIDRNKDNPVVARDGYALLFMGGSVSISKYTVKYGDTQVWTLENTAEGLMWTCEWTEEGKAKFTDNSDPANPKVADPPIPQKARSFTLPRVEGSEPAECQNLPDRNYILVLLPDAVVTGNFAYGDNFYQKLTATKVGDTSEKPANFYFNPLFARTVEEEDRTTALTDGTDSVYIRTARHFYDLSRLYDTRYLYNDDKKIDENDRNFIMGQGENSYIKNNYYNKGYSFLQELDIDYSTYSWYGAIPAERENTGYREQHPIGVGIFGLTTESTLTEYNAPFKGNYDGGCHIIRNVIFRGTGYYVGLFGMTEKYSIGTGTVKKTPVLKNIVYELDPAVPVTYYSSDTAGTNNQDAGHFRAIGALVGKNDGIMENCAVYGVNMNARGKYIGGLLGYNQDTVQNCAAELASLTVTLFNDSDEVSCAGGLVGKQNNDSCQVEKSYAVGKLVCAGSLGKDGEAIAGLVAHKGKVINCYAAVDLAVSGTHSVERFGLCRNTETSNDRVNPITDSGWLKDVFVYRGEKYNITATTDYADSAQAFTFTELKGMLSLSQFATQIMADNTVRNIPDGEAGDKYRSAYENKSFPYLTGVKTTLARSADGFITGKVTDMTDRRSIHYGLWPAPLPVGLAYYETYEKDAKTAYVSGQYENLRLNNLKKDTESPVVYRDGYALVFEGTTDVPAGEYKTEYGNTDTKKKKFTLIKEYNDGKWYWRPEGDNNKYEYPAYITTVDGVTYTVVPLPTSVVTGELSEGANFYQRLVYGEGLFSARTFYFNPHFAGTLAVEDGETVLKSVEAGTVASNAEYTVPGMPVDPENPALIGADRPGLYFSMAWDIERNWKNVVSVRTPRHFYALSRFQEYYIAKQPVYNEDGSVKQEGVPKLYYFKQELDIDYYPYDWYGVETCNPAEQDGRYYTQNSIGTAWRAKNKKERNHDDGFKGAYNGGGHRIRNVFYNVTPDESSSSQYMGLFRYGEFLWNLTYEVPNGVTVTLENDKTFPNDANANDRLVELTNGVKVGTLMGGSFRTWNCHAIVNNLTVEVRGGGRAYIGGLAGFANKAQDCDVTITGSLTVRGNADRVSVGGLQGLLYNEMLNCTSRVNTIVVEGNGKSEYYAGGLVGSVSNTNENTVALTVSGCGVEVKDLRITGEVKEGYAGGLIGYNINTSVDIGAPEGGGKIYASYAVGAIGFGDNVAENSYYAGFVGKNHSAGKVQDCYSAVGVPNKHGYNFCSNGDGTFKNCRYLSGSWTYGGQSYAALPDVKIDEVNQTGYEDLQKFTTTAHTESFSYWGRTYYYNIPAMQAVTGGYPFPVGTRNLEKDADGNVIYDGKDGQGSLILVYNAYCYPGGDWPNKYPANAVVMLLEPVLLPEPEVEPELEPAPDPELLPEPEVEPEPEPAPEGESEPTL